ncbi:oxidoreductase [Paenibacillus sp. BIHB 4019]|uniref:Oxidoreductase n=1 Tax=Paenibacillus sp. BIHB 4019 TaxID=1870819 RepID=A0A1B2DQV3_9BACL|nr:PhzF family phenazine biosynthesis protein [Paenibacillus sp. BIHB 4019]ANY70086.1 oxidoreductase [Paenibacillus sp. BIHB 4019]
MVPIYIVDAFTSEAFGGNPAAVCLLEALSDERWMQQVAAEMNLSETAFVAPREGGYELRWFTPASEVDLCGHATLAAAFVLWKAERLSPNQAAAFWTRSGVLTVELGEDGAEMTMNFPSEPPAPAKAPEALIEGLGLIPRYTGRNRMDYVVEVDSEQTVRALKPDFSQLRLLDGRGVVVTARAEGQAAYDFVSRAFYPNMGVLEDPVTGSAHCALAPYWAKRLRKDELVGYQASARGGFVKVKNTMDRVQLSGQAVLMMRGELEEI